MLRALFRSPSGIICTVFIGILVLVAIIAPIVFNQAATNQVLTQTMQGPSAHHWFGTDNLGRDVLARVLVATRLTLVMAVESVLVSTVIGTLLGTATAQLGPRARAVAARAIDTCLAFPGLIIAIYISTVIGLNSTLGPVLGIGVAGSFAFARVTSSLTMSVTGREYVLAARVVGVSRVKVLVRYILPNIAETLIITATVTVSVAIVALASLSFLGLGVQPPQYDWGQLLNGAVQEIQQIPAATLAPALAIGFTSLAFGFFGEAWARAMNPLLWSLDKGRHEAPLTAAPVEPDLETGASDLPAAVNTNGQRPALEVKGLRVALPGPGGTTTLVHEVSFALAAGGRLGIVGESGSGKTLTAMAIAHLVPYPLVVSGDIEFEGQSASRKSRKEAASLLQRSVAVVFQDPLSALNPALRIGRQMTEALRVHRRMKAREALKLSSEGLRRVQVPEPEGQARRYPHEFSGGMRQRILIATALLNEPRVLIADEPTTALDVTVQAQVMDLLEDTQREGTSLVLISHNLALVKQNCDRVIVMYGGRVMEEIASSDLLRAEHPYTRVLLEAVPDIDRPRGAPLVEIPGSSPDPAANIPGCPFHPRCPHAMPRCKEQVPDLIEAKDGGHRVACWLGREN